jgi:hypothetical protein
MPMPQQAKSKDCLHSIRMFEVKGSSRKAGLEVGGKGMKNLPKVKRSSSEAILDPKAKRS